MIGEGRLSIALRVEKGVVDFESLYTFTPLAVRTNSILCGSGRNSSMLFCTCSRRQPSTARDGHRGHYVLLVVLSDKRRAAKAEGQFSEHYFIIPCTVDVGFLPPGSKRYFPRPKTVRAPKHRRVIRIEHGPVIPPSGLRKAQAWPPRILPCLSGDPGGLAIC